LSDLPILKPSGFQPYWFSDPWSFQFFQAVRLLERFGTGKPVGRFENPAEEPVRFSTNPTLVFPSS